MAPPGAGQPREAVMDANPWTYQVMGQEMDRWYTDISTDPALAPARRRPPVRLRAAGHHRDGGGVGRASISSWPGSTTWYQSDLGSGYPLIGTGVVRTVVKLPTDWTSRAITGVRVRVFPAASRRLGEREPGGRPRPGLELGAVGRAHPDADGGGGHGLGAGGAARSRSQPPGSRTGPSRRRSGPLAATVTDSLGQRLAGVPVAFAATAGPTVTFTGCGCASLTVVTGSPTARPARGRPPPAPTSGTTTVSASVPDPLAAPATFTVRVVASHAV